MDIPLAEEYYWISPYAYVANNPIRFLDPTGKELVDANGKKITYSLEKGCSENASKEFKKFGNLLLSSTKGNSVIFDAMQTNYPISISFSNEESSCLGICKPKIVEYQTNPKSYKVKSVNVTILYKAISDELEKYEKVKKEELINSTLSGRHDPAMSKC